jgi:hypothetical protein
MRVLAAFLLSFVLVGTVGALILPSPSPRAKPKSPAGSVPVKPILDFLPDVPSFVVPRREDTSKGYAEAWRLLKAGEWRTAEGAYLDIVIRTPQDRKAMQGLVTLQRLLASQNPKRLQEQAEAYRRAIAEGRTAEGRHTPREMELLAEASLLAATEISAEQNLKLSSASRVSVSADLLRPPSPPPTTVARDPVSAIKDRISQVARSLRLAPAKPGVLVGVQVADTRQVAPPSIARTPSLRLPGDGKPSGSAIDEAANPVTEKPQGGATSPGGTAGVGGPPPAGSQSKAGVNDSSREGGGANGGSSSGSSGGSTGSGGSSGGSGNSGVGNGGSGGASAGSGSGSGAGASAGASGAGSTGGSGNSASKEGAGKGDKKGDNENSGGGKGGSGKGGKD